MTYLSDLEYLKLNKFQKFIYNFLSFFARIPFHLWNLLKAVGRFFKKIFLLFINCLKFVGVTFVKGDWKTKVSYFILGFGNAARGQWLRGLLFFALEVAFIIYMVLVGGPNVAKLNTLGTVETVNTVEIIAGIEVPKVIYGDNSFNILLYGVLSFFFIAAFIFTWYLNIKQNSICEEILDVPARKAFAKERQEKITEWLKTHQQRTRAVSKEEIRKRQFEICSRYEQELAEIPNDRAHRRERKEVLKLRNLELKHVKEPLEIIAIRAEYQRKIDACGKPLKSGKQDVQSLVDDQFHKSLLSLPIIGMTIFTVMPTFFMILIAFTSYSGPYNIPPNGLFTWVGFKNFGQVLSWNNGNTYFAATFGEVLLWTIIWAFFATFTNYFLGMLVALAINKKGIKGKKIWRGILVLTIAIPQFISLLFISKMFAKDGIINTTLMNWGWIDKAIPFFEERWPARITVIGINIWIGIPYLMLMISGVLMNIPADLYESAKIDGANGLQQYFKITLPYTLFVTGPYLLTSFTGNMNNFNVLYLLTGGGPFKNMDMSMAGAGDTDLLITWLFKLTIEKQNYYMAAVIGILVFLVVAIISLIVYNIIPSVKNEEDFQ